MERTACLGADGYNIALLHKGGHGGYPRGGGFGGQKWGVWGGGGVGGMGVYGGVLPRTSFWDTFN